MTVPFSNLVGEFGVGSKAYQDQLNSFLAMQDAFAMANRQGQQGGGYGVQMTQQPGITYPQAHQAPMADSSWHDEDLVAAGMYWGIPEGAARAMPREQLMAIVNEKRSALQLQEPIQPMTEQLKNSAGLGLLQGITGGLRNLPFVGEALDRIDLLHNADMKLRMMEEAVKASTPESMQWMNSGANLAGNLATMWYPASAAWNVAGKVGGLIPFLNGSRYAMAAFQGGASASLLEGGSDAFKEHPLMMLGGGAALGVTGEKVASWLATRVTKSFVNPAMLGPELPPGGLNPMTMQKGQSQFADVFAGPQAFEPVQRSAPMTGAGSEGMVLSGSDAFFGFQPPRPQPRGIELTSSVDPTVEGLISRNTIPDELPWRLSTFTKTAEGTQASGHQDYGSPLEALKELQLDDTREMINYFKFQPKGMSFTEAEALAAQMNKAGTIVQSPAFPEIAGQAQIDDLAVVRAAEATNPGGKHIIQGVTNPGEFIMNLGPNARFVPRQGRLDAIIIPTNHPDPDLLVKQYSKFGFFEGQEVLTSDGSTGMLSHLDRDGAVFTPSFSGAPREVGYKTLQGMVTSPEVQEAPQLWEAFTNYADHRATGSAAAMSRTPTVEQIASIKQQNLVPYANEFLGNIGIKSQADQARIINYFNKRYVDSFKELAPLETAQQQIATANYNDVLQKTTTTPLGTLDEIATSKGFVVVPQADGGFALKDLLIEGPDSPTLGFKTVEAAQTWLTQTARELPDITPPSDVPLELVAQFPRSATQGPNLNADFTKNAAAAISELSAESGGAFVPPGEAVAQAGGPDNIGRLKNQWFDGFTRWQPARRLWSKLDQAMVELGAPSNLAVDAERIAQRGVQNNNEMHDLMDSLTDVTRKIKTNRLVTGEWSRLAALARGQREAQAAAAGLPQAEIDAFGEMDQLIQRINQRVSGTNDPVDAGSVWEYFSHIATKQSDPATVASAFEGFSQTSATEPFYQFAKTGNLNFREGDPRHIMESYIRAMFWQKNMSAPFAELTTKWKGLAEIEELKPVANLMQNYLKIVRYGYHAEDDIALDMLHASLSGVLGKGVTRQQARELFNYGLNTTHSAMLGFRPHVMARDALQLFLAVPRAGADLVSTMFKAITDPREIGRLYQEAVAEGVVALQSPRMAAPGSFSGTLERLSAEAGQLEPSLPLPPEQYSKRMMAAAKVTEAVRDMMPSWLRDTRDSPLHAMYLYGKQSEMMKALVYGAGKEKAARALAVYRSAGPSGNLDELMGASAARTFDPSWQRQFQQIVASGDDVAAAKYLGKQLADATQFKYGQLESPMAGRSITGRVAMQMGNYQMQYIQYLRESLVNGNWVDKTKLALTFGAVTAGIEAASRETGWNFRLMNPFFGLGFVGGPWVEIGVNIAQGVGSAARELQGGRPDEAAYAMGGAAASQAIQNLNPAGGLIRMAQGLGEAQNSPYPGQAVGRLLLTGEMGAGPDVNQWMMPQASEIFQRSLQPTPSPVSATQFGLPAGVFPEQVPSYPPEMSAPPSTMPQGNMSPQGSAPGGSPYGHRPTPNSLSPEVLNRAVMGDREALSQFDTEDQMFLSKLGPVPPDVRMQVWASYSIQKINRQAGQGPTGTAGSLQSNAYSTNGNPNGMMQ